ncbi:MAG: hypothetical protein QOF26_2769 [Baekduia sp.]|nr:hypothetical protein [Baekduia sp.]
MRRRDALPEPEAVRGLRELEAALAAAPGADPDLATLVADVDAARPQPSAAFLASLDARVHAGFPTDAVAPRRAAREPWHARLRRRQILLPVAGLGLAAALAALVVSLPGGGGARSGDSASMGRKPPATQQHDSAAVPAAAGGSASSSGAAPAAKAAPIAPLPSTTTSATPRKVQRAAELTLTPAAGGVQDTADGVVRETQAAGGYVQQSQVATQDGGGDATFTLRIPSARLDDALARLSRLAHVGALQQSATDITAATVSAADRLGDARAERQALLNALGRATTDRQIASLKARLRDNRSEIAARKGALDAQRRRADLATVGVTITAVGAGHGGGGSWTPRDALHDAGRVLEVAGGIALIALAVLLPVGVLAALGLLGSRIVRRHRREAALDRTA